MTGEAGRNSAKRARRNSAVDQLMKSMNDHLSQLKVVMTQVSAVVTALIALSMNYLTAVLVGAVGGPCNSMAGQVLQSEPQ